MTSEDHRQRLQNFADMHAMLGDMPWQAVRDYIPGQVVYNLSEYPVATPLGPNEYDEELLGRFASEGVGLIQIHEDWNDSQRVLGADKFSSPDPEGLQRFVDLVHSLGMRIIPYISTGYFDVKDPDFQDSWHDPQRGRLIELYFDYAHCSPSSPEWRAYLLPRLEQVLDQYGFDGLYNDMGYARHLDGQPLLDGQVRPAPHTHAAMEDLLSLVYEMVKQRGGIVKCHGCPPECTERMRVYDYLWVGEAVKSLEKLRDDSRNLQPYLSPCPDMSRAEVVDEHELYLYTIPYLQFPLRVDGRPVTGERASAPGVAYPPEEKCFWTRHMRAIRKFYLEHPEGPYNYGWWDSSPGRPQARDLWFDHLRLYRPMVENQSRAWVEVGQTPLFKWRLPEKVTATFYVNTETYLVLANFGDQAAIVDSAWEWENRRTGERASKITLQSRQLAFLKRV